MLELQIVVRISFKKVAVNVSLINEQRFAVKTAHREDDCWTWDVSDWRWRKWRAQSFLTGMETWPWTVYLFLFQQIHARFRTYSTVYIWTLCVCLGSGPCASVVLLPRQPDRGARGEPREHGVRWLQVSHPEGSGKSGWALVAFNVSSHSLFQSKIFLLSNRSICNTSN